MKIHVRQETMLGVVRADAYGSGIAVADVEIDVAERGIKSARACVGWSGVCSLRAGGRRSTLRWATTREENHVAGALLKTRRVCAQDKHRPRRSVADDTDSRPDVNRTGKALAAGGQKENTLNGAFLDGFDGLLHGVGSVGTAVGVHGKLVQIERD